MAATFTYLVCFRTHFQKFAVMVFFFRWKRDSSGEKVFKDGKPVLEFVAIQRTDCSEWALPGVGKKNCAMCQPTVNVFKPIREPPLL